MLKKIAFPQWLYDHVTYVAWVQAFLALIVSLYFSEIKHFAPCLLCWYQRILMYPLVLIIAVGIVRKDKGLHLYVLPLSLIGMGMAAYHYLLQAGVIPESIAPCTIGVSCLTQYEVYLRIFTIPLLSFIAFTLITLCMIVFWHGERKRL